jgi:hypothetical protein
MLVVVAGWLDGKARVKVTHSTSLPTKREFRWVASNKVEQQQQL